MIRSVTVSVTAGAGAIVQVIGRVGRKGFVDKLQSLWTTQVAAALLIATKEQDRLIRTSLAPQYVQRTGIPIDAELLDGERLHVGIENNSGGSITQDITIVYDEQPV